MPLSAPVVVAASAGCLTCCLLLLLPVRAFLASYTGRLDPRLVLRPAWVALPRLGPAMLLASLATTVAALRTPWPRACVSPTVSATMPVLEGVTAALLVAAACCDLACRRLPNRLLGPAGVLALSHTIVASWWLGTPLRPMWFALMAGAVAWALTSTGKVGVGDAKLIVVSLIWLTPLDWEGFGRGLVWGLLAAGAYTLGGYWRGRLDRDSVVALGPFLVAGALAARIVVAL